MAPEQEAGQLSPQTDIYSLGTTMYELVTGIRPISIGAPRQPWPWHRPSPTDATPYVPTWLSDLILKATEREPANRFHNCAEMLRVLQEHRNEGSHHMANIASTVLTRDQRVIGQFNNVIASLNMTSQPELAHALKLFKEGIMASIVEISPHEKQELIEIVNQVGEEAT